MNRAQNGYIKEKVNEARKKVLRMCANANAGHLTTAYSCAEIVGVLYYGIMNIDPQRPRMENRDRFILSKNHGAVMTLPILSDLGYFPEDELMTFMRNGSRLGGHSKIGVEGIDFSGGSLGIGLGVGAGLAYAARYDRKEWYTFVVLGDGECYEGSVWEAAMFAGHHKLKNLVVVLDHNGMCCTDFTEALLRQEPLSDKWKAFGWDTAEVDGHSVEELMAALGDVRDRSSDKPLCIIANTVKGKGVRFICDKPLMHGRALVGEEFETALAELTRGDGQ